MGERSSRTAFARAVTFAVLAVCWYLLGTVVWRPPISFVMLSLGVAAAAQAAWWWRRVATMRRRELSTTRVGHWESQPPQPGPTRKS